ncbi:branched-chain amino acid ABC transporter ATP-binding protein/permease [Pollutimonas bauzanensis]|uniref:Amino acid/amide ABC transporter membrane protein 2, HAAT family /amino acid/amide ABC transporter ATP-binding protein 1, HAAT family n=1 Tax=Pollutimonas bauzanensis TaxID=658167 RepID=A0A1M5YQC6_9BURK|nr:branched-chain amino acid ABC transporter ATP-binding protein/permease [Pollutimonas bauzanensis]SHI14242.1 amino acid/amide ABC transporter membrane protein 2, HAAT family /amino acid/amide ABC transporter ATP-binding protein 1, HAAT family [Pollutimonas bauzanensis]
MMNQPNQSVAIDAGAKASKAAGHAAGGRPGGGLRRRYSVEFFTAMVLAVAPFLAPLVGAGPDLLGRVLIWGLFGLGFDLLFGYAGLLSFGQAAFYGTGSFVTAYLLTTGLIPNMLLALLAAMLVASVLGLLIGYLTLRRSGIYFAMSTLAFAEMIYFLEFGPLREWTGGENGIPGIPEPVLDFGFYSVLIQPGWPMYTFLAGMFFIGFIIARRIALSPFGVVLTAIRGNPTRAMAVGHRIQRYKLAVFVVAAAYGGVAGGLLGLFQGYMPPDAFNLHTSAELVIQTVMGGSGTLFGPLLGALIWLYLYEVLQFVDAVGAYWRLILGVIFVILVTVFRRGICGEFIAWRDKRMTRRLTRAIGAGNGGPASGQRHGGQLLMRQARPAPDGAPVLQANNIAKHYGGLKAVKGVSISIEEGELRGLIGPNGAGKSTFFKMLAGEIEPTSGEVFLRGSNITGIGVTQVCQLGMSKSYQVNELFDALTVRQNILMSVLGRQRGSFRFDALASLNGVSGYGQQVEAALELVELAHKADTLVHELSYGEKRRVEIGLALATGANVLLLDEPLAGMSPEERVQTVALLKSIRRGRTLLIVEHDMDAMFELADKITVLYDGNFLAEGTPEEIRNSKAVQEAYLGGVDAS